MFAPAMTAPLESVTIPETPAATLACDRTVRPHATLNRSNARKENLNPPRLNPAAVPFL
jgi:hypothetical protein